MVLGPLTVLMVLTAMVGTMALGWYLSNRGRWRTFSIVFGLVFLYGLVRWLIAENAPEPIDLLSAAVFLGSAFALIIAAYRVERTSVMYPVIFFGFVGFVLASSAFNGFEPAYGGYVPERCTFGVGVYCNDYVYLEDETIIIRLENQAGGSVLENATLSRNFERRGVECSATRIVSPSGENLSFPLGWDLNETVDIYFTGCPADDTLRLQAELIFTNETIIGELLVKR